MNRGDVVTTDPSTTTHSPERRAGKALPILSFVVAILALTISVFTFFSGTAKQSSFETRRQLCVESLTGYAKSLMDVRFTTTKLSSSQIAAVTADGAAARISCFDSRVLNPDSQFARTWVQSKICSNSRSRSNPGIGRTTRLRR